MKSAEKMSEHSSRSSARPSWEAAGSSGKDMSRDLPAQCSCQRLHGPALIHYQAAHLAPSALAWSSQAASLGSLTPAAAAAYLLHTAHCSLLSWNWVAHIA